VYTLHCIRDEREWLFKSNSLLFPVVIPRFSLVFISISFPLVIPIPSRSYSHTSTTTANTNKYAPTKRKTTVINKPVIIMDLSPTPNSIVILSCISSSTCLLTSKLICAFKNIVIRKKTILQEREYVVKAVYEKLQFKRSSLLTRYKCPYSYQCCQSSLLQIAM